MAKMVDAEDLRKGRMEEPEKRVLLAKRSDGKSTGRDVAFVQVGWRVTFLDGDATPLFFTMTDPLLEHRLHQAASVEPVWVEELGATDNG